MLLLIPITLLYGFFAAFGLKKVFGAVEIAAPATLPKGVSIVIAMRNEERFIVSLLKSILKNKPPFAYEIIVIDDGSDDGCFELVKALANANPLIKLLQGTGMGKKSAVEYGVLSAKYPIVLQTDADCLVGERWIEQSVHPLLSNDTSLVLGPVYPVQQSTVLNSMIRLEWLALQFVTVFTAKINHAGLANGANLTYFKADYLAFSESKHGSKYASGDDMFFLSFLRKQKKKIVFNLKQGAIVKTVMPSSFGALIKQRIRWSTKSSKTTNLMTSAFLLIITLANFAWIGALFGDFSDARSIVVFSICVIWKMVIDTLICWNMSRFYEDKSVLKFIPILFLVYPFYLLLGFILSLSKKYEWKGRQLK